MPLNCVGYSSPALSGEIKLPSRYSNINHIGQGSTCVVLKAHDTFLDRIVAIKFMRPELNDFNSVRRFQQEAKVMSAFRMNHLPVVLDFGLSPCGRPYMVMELVQGTSLKNVLAEQGRLDAELAIEITIQILTALEHAHERGIVHRDLKSHNVMVSWDDEDKPFVKVVDFGLAIGINLPCHITAAGAALGTPSYMSPEQAQGRVTDARSDIYSLGCVLYEMLSGETPFVTNSVTETLNAHINETAPRLGFIPGVDDRVQVELRSIVAACLAKRPENRFSSAKQLRVTLTELAHHLRKYREENADEVGLQLQQRESKTDSIMKSKPYFSTGVASFAGREGNVAKLQLALAVVAVMFFTSVVMLFCQPATSAHQSVATTSVQPDGGFYGSSYLAFPMAKDVDVVSLGDAIRDSYISEEQK